ncbi:hypothetical protein NDU88_007071 [Pleurodeles waltl]|uniref:Uncharacterized protein n=1 Tax=Pleurodeles waltl TaxID=8319 RepID=A0AAV7N139_PLEWA|nr:hypothetical protein NDU88_007071 [Pleurodeles waltl]
MDLRRRCYGGGGAPDPVCCPAVFSPPVAPPGSSQLGALALSGHLVSWPGHTPPVYLFLDTIDLKKE